MFSMTRSCHGRSSLAATCQEAHTRTGLDTALKNHGSSPASPQQPHRRYTNDHQRHKEEKLGFAHILRGFSSADAAAPCIYPKIRFLRHKGHTVATRRQAAGAASMHVRFVNWQCCHLHNLSTGLKTIELGTPE